MIFIFIYIGIAITNFLLLNLYDKIISQCINLIKQYKLLNARKWTKLECSISDILIICCIPFINIIFFFLSMGMCFEELKELYKYKKEIDETKQDRRFKHIDEMFHNLFCSHYFTSLRSIETFYNSIIQQDLYKEMAINRVEYVLTLLEEYKKNNLLESNINDIEKILTTTLNFLKELQEQINKKDTKVKKEVNEYLRKKLDDYINTTDEMKKGLVEVRQIENK